MSAEASDIHDLPLGHLDHCQVCGHEDLELILDLGHQPPCDSLVPLDGLQQEEISYPLRFLRCGRCGLAQIDYVVDPKILFHPTYPYLSGITPTLATNLKKTAERTLQVFPTSEESFVVDIGSNDGTLLQGFAARGMKVLGVEATEIAGVANAAGIPTRRAFFTNSVAQDLVDEQGHAAVVTATNMFAHVQRLGDLLEGVHVLLKDGGVFVSESHYLLDLLETVQYDSIYHEHLKFYSLKPLRRLLESHGFQIAHAERIPNYGGSIRVFAVKGEAKASDSIAELMAEEERQGLYESDTFVRFSNRAQQSKRSLRKILMDIQERGERVAAVGCPGRASTLVNYCRLDTETLPYIAEQSTSLKLGLYLPGAHIPVVDEARLFEEQPEYALMLSWHYAAPIIESLRRKGLRSKIILPLPEVTVVE